MKKIAIVTGGSSGIGEATARELSKRGWGVAVTYSKDAKKAEKVAAEIRGFPIRGDVALDADCRRIAKEVLAKWGRIDALVNNAGTTKFVKHADLEGLSAEDFERIFRVNVVGPFQMIRACAAALKESRGAVVNVSSVAYAASKAALETMSFSLARSLGPEVRVNIVAPGHVNTPWQVNAHGEKGAEEIAQRFASIAPLKTACEAEDVADAIVWLIEGARRVTGERLYVDAGVHIASSR